MSEDTRLPPLCAPDGAEPFLGVHLAVLTTSRNAPGGANLFLEKIGRFVPRGTQLSVCEGAALYRNEYTWPGRHFGSRTKQEKLTDHTNYKLHDIFV